MLLYGQKVKQWIFSEKILVYDIKVDRCSQLNDPAFLKFQEHEQAWIFQFHSR